MATTDWFGRLAQVLNWVHYELAQEGKEFAQAYEPVKLHLLIPPETGSGFRLWMGQGFVGEKTTSFNETSPKLDFESFKFVLEQVPTIQHIEFSGWGEAFKNPDLFQMIRYAHDEKRILSTVYSHGQFDKDQFQPLFTSGLERLVINMAAHKPSAYAALTKQSANEFLNLEKLVEQLVLVRQHYPGPQVKLELSMTVDLMNLYQIPEMIHYAEGLGVDGILFENALGSLQDERSLQTILKSYKKAEQFLQEVAQQSFSIEVTLPPLLDPDMSSHRHCQDPHNTVSLNEDLYISPCSRHRVFNTLTHSVWDQDFWNNDQFLWLRKRHNPNSGEDVPNPCQFCPKNLKERGKVIPAKSPALAEPTIYPVDAPCRKTS